MAAVGSSGGRAAGTLVLADAAIQRSEMNKLLTAVEASQSAMKKYLESPSAVTEGNTIRNMASCLTEVRSRPLSAQIRTSRAWRKKIFILTVGIAPVIGALPGCSSGSDSNASELPPTGAIAAGSTASSTVSSPLAGTDGRTTTFQIVNQDGDTASGTLVIGEPGPATSFGEVISACGPALGPPERQLVIPVEVTLTLTSSMAAGAGMLLESRNGLDTTDDLSVSSGTGNCTNARNGLNWQLQPGQSGTGTVFYIDRDGITPNFPSGDPAKLSTFGVYAIASVGSADGNEVTWSGALATGCTNSNADTQPPTLTLMSPKPACPP